MISAFAKLATGLILGMAIVAFFAACAGRRVTTSVEDQTFVPGPPPQAAAPTREAAKAAPPQPAPAEAPTVEAPVPAAPVEEARITEPPIASPPAVERPSALPAPAPVTPLAPAVAGGSLSDVYFDFDQFLIRRDAETVLEADAKQLKGKDTQKILIEGHCDERGTLAYNLVLGERRARAVKQYLQDLGVPASQLQITSYGKERPFCTDPSEACWQSNRRAHFRQP